MRVLRSDPTGTCRRDDRHEDLASFGQNLTKTAILVSPKRVLRWVHKIEVGKWAVPDF
jgi:hypothetical protein